MQMSYAEFGSTARPSGGAGGGGSDSLPSWAQRANEPLVPAIDIATIKKAVSADLKEVRKATDKLAKLSAAAKKKYGAAVGDELVAISSATRERARNTSRMLQEALAQVEDGSAEHRTLTLLSEDFKQTLRKFTQQVEATSHLAAAPARHATWSKVGWVAVPRRRILAAPGAQGAAAAAVSVVRGVASKTVWSRTKCTSSRCLWLPRTRKSSPTAR